MHTCITGEGGGGTPPHQGALKGCITRQHLSPSCHSPPTTPYRNAGPTVPTAVMVSVQICGRTLMPIQTHTCYTRGTHMNGPPPGLPSHMALHTWSSVKCALANQVSINAVESEWLRLGMTHKCVARQLESNLIAVVCSNPIGWFTGKASTIIFLRLTDLLKFKAAPNYISL